MCPVCMTSAALVAAGTTSGVGVLGLVAVTFRWLRRFAIAPSNYPSPQLRSNSRNRSSRR